MSFLFARLSIYNFFVQYMIYFMTYFPAHSPALLAVVEDE